jgi:osmotically-inducible protein OsmY
MRVVMRFGQVLLLTSGLAFLAAACSATEAETGLHQRANEALKEARLDQVEAEWDPNSQALMLRGFVLSPEDKRRAEDVARSVIGSSGGSSGQVVNELTITTRGAPTPAPVLASSGDLDRIDDRIRRDVEQLFSDDDVWGGREFEILVRAGDVRLTGEVFSQAEKDRVTEMVAGVAGVTGVVNRLSVRNPADPDRSA